MEIRDPIHGPIAVSPAEIAVIDSRYFQRLRGIKQLGFSELTFPGASHSRLLHSLGAMHLAGQAFDAIFRDSMWLQSDDRTRLRQTVRLAALCHDLGHPPLSHASEMLLPRLGPLKVPHLRVTDGERQASHEHYTLKLLLDSGLSAIIGTACASLGIQALHVAALLSEDILCDSSVFEVGDRNLQGLLAAIVSSELDVDRMDYLLRDSYFTGVSYGKFDVDWLIGHLTHRQDEDGSLQLALHERAIFTFDDFLLSRHHMFLMVYFHKKSVCYDHMLQHFYAEFPGACAAPADAEAYVDLDDAAVWRALREHAGRSTWADGILLQRPLKLLAETALSSRPEPIAPLVERLRAESIPHLHITSQGALSKYHPTDHARAIYVRKQPPVGEPCFVPLAEATRLYERYADSTVLERLYVQPACVDRAAAWLIELRGS